MTTVKPHTLNRPLAELRQLRETPTIIAALSQQELLAIALYAITEEESSRYHPNAPRMDNVVDAHINAPAA